MTIGVLLNQDAGRTGVTMAFLVIDEYGRRRRAGHDRRLSSKQVIGEIEDELTSNEGKYWTVEKPAATLRWP